MSNRGNHDLDFFDWEGIRIYQNEVVHKVGTDAVLLGTWVATILSDPKFILDAGTGSGILALMMAKNFPLSNIHAMDIDKDAIELARKNVTVSEYVNRITISCENILEMNSAPACYYDLILSNPPFYTEHIRSAHEYKRRAKHITASEAEWIQCLVKRLTPDGHLCIVVPFDAARNWIHAANENGHYIQHRLDVFSFTTDTTPKRSLLHFAPCLKRPMNEDLSIYQSDHEYTEAYLRLTGIRAKT